MKKSNLSVSAVLFMGAAVIVGYSRADDTGTTRSFSGKANCR